MAPKKKQKKAAAPEAEILERRRKLLRLREKFVYNFEGSKPDAFSVLLRELSRTMGGAFG